MQETWVRSLGWEGPLEKEMATHSSILAWRIPGTGNLVGHSPRGRKESDTTERLSLSLYIGLCVSRSVTSDSLWTIAHQGPPSMGFSRQEYWSGLPFLSPGDLPNPGIEPRSPALQADSSPAEPQGSPHIGEEGEVVSIT